MCSRARLDCYARETTKSVPEPRRSQVPFLETVGIVARIKASVDPTGWLGLGMSQESYKVSEINGTHDIEQVMGEIQRGVFVKVSRTAVQNE